MEGYFRWLVREHPDIFYISPSANAMENVDVSPAVIQAILAENIKTIFIPLNHNNNHWTLLVIDVANLTYFHFDPMFASGLNGERIKKIMNDIKQNIGLDFKYESVETIPQRSNWECGYHCLMMAYSYGVDRSIPQFNDVFRMRRFLSNNIINSDRSCYHPVIMQASSKATQLSQREASSKATQLSQQASSKAVQLSQQEVSSTKESMEQSNVFSPDR